MTRLLLDTTVLVDVERMGASLDEVIADDDDVAIAAITVAELRVGALLADGRRRAARRAYVDDVVAHIPVLDYDLATATEHAGLLVAVRPRGRPRGAHDLIIAATARATARTVVTADARAFADLPGIEVRAGRGRATA
ncbi:MAG: PIN domain-containing protein [Acidimicrobiales bacterium]|nr:PIN domain-containing protein [Acidimicrobiales bacterium]